MSLARLTFPALAAAVLTLMSFAALSASAQARPFPTDHAWDGDYFSTPSGKTACYYGKLRELSCTNYDGNFAGQKVWYVGQAGRAWMQHDMSNFPVEDLPRAKYGVTYRHGAIRCRINKATGIRCTNRSGYGFVVNAQKPKVF